MIDFSNASIEHLMVHRVGNIHREEPNFFSENPIQIDSYTYDVLKQYFFKPFNKVDERWRFSHTTDMAYHVMNGLVNDLLEDESLLIEHSVNIVNHLYEQSDHPHIKAGDVFIAVINDILIDDELVNGLGIFKAENKDHFLKVGTDENEIELFPDSGINIKKLDKGCIVFNVLKEEGYQIMTVDQNKYDAEYWTEKFLGLEYIKDDHYETKSYIQMCKSFAEEVVHKYEGKQEEVVFLNEAVKYFDNNEQLTVDEFAEEVFPTEEKKKVFEEYKKQYEYKNEVELAESFDISPKEVKKQKRKLKNDIKLDTNIQIKMDFNNPESSKRFVEKGYDAERGMNFYKIYFNNELN